MCKFSTLQTILGLIILNNQPTPRINPSNPPQRERERERERDLLGTFYTSGSRSSPAHRLQEARTGKPISSADRRGV